MHLPMALISSPGPLQTTSLLGTSAVWWVDGREGGRSATQSVWELPKLGLADGVGSPGYLARDQTPCLLHLQMSGFGIFCVSMRHLLLSEGLSFAACVRFFSLRLFVSFETLSLFLKPPEGVGGFSSYFEARFSQMCVFFFLNVTFFLLRKVSAHVTFSLRPSQLPRNHRSLRPRHHCKVQ